MRIDERVRSGKGPNDEHDCIHNFPCDIFSSVNDFISLNEKRELDCAPKRVLTAYIFSYKSEEKN